MEFWPDMTFRSWQVTSWNHLHGNNIKFDCDISGQASAKLAWLVHTANCLCDIKSMYGVELLQCVPAYDTTLCEQL